MGKFDVGTRHNTNNFGIIEITKYINPNRRTILFLGSMTSIDASVGAICTGRIRDPMVPTVYGVGYIGIGEYKTTINYKYTESYKCWRGMIQRCYDHKTLEKAPSYKGCKVCDSWKNFQIFSEWFYENHREGFSLDKDLLYHGNTLYSPETCIFLPRKINCILSRFKSDNKSGFTGAYYNKKTKKYYSQCREFGTSAKKTTGHYDTAEDAHVAYIKYKTTQVEESIKYLVGLGYSKETSSKMKNFI